LSFKHDKNKYLIFDIYLKSVEYLNKSITKIKKIYSPTHPSLETCYNDLADAYYKLESPRYFLNSLKSLKNREQVCKDLLLFGKKML
jgi:hypothetical protein